jgi:PAS domain-containing protein
LERILLLLEHRENRRLLSELLAQNYDIVNADSIGALDGAFDLGITDGVALDRYWQNIQSRRSGEVPIFLPFLLVVSRQDVGMITRHLWQAVDELILSPIEKIELLARVEMLLRSRRYSIEMESRYYTLAENAPVGVYVVQNGQMVYSNPTMARILQRAWPVGDGQSAIRVSQMDGMESEQAPDGSLMDWIVRLDGTRSAHLQIQTSAGERILEIRTNSGQHQGRPSILGIVMDITEHDTPS